MNAKTKILQLFAPVVTGALLLVACQNNASSTNQGQIQTDLPEEETIAITALAVKPPIPGIDVPFNSYAVPVAKGMVIETATGTTIEIPANAFVDEDGKLVEGEVNIKFREFHNATDIISSGIPMHNPETGEYMETAGMFEMQGEQNGAAIFVKGDMDIQVNLASYNEGDNFNFYKLGSKDCRWEDKGTGKAKPNKLKKAQLDKLDNALPQKPIKPRKRAQAENFVFDLDVNYSMFPELKTFRGILWEYAGKGKNPEKNDWIFESNWDKINLAKSDETGYFELTLLNKNKSFKTLVRPILNDENYEEALAEFSASKMEAYTKVKKAQAEERSRLAMQADLTRSFDVNGFGIYNWDIWHQPGRTRCVAKPTFDELANVNEDVNRIDFFLVMGGMRSVVRYTPKTLSKFSFNPDAKNTLLAILPEGKIAVFSASDFKNLDLDKIENDKHALLKMATSVISVSSMGDLDEVINEGLMT